MAIDACPETIFEILLQNHNLGTCRRGLLAPAPGALPAPCPPPLLAPTTAHGRSAAHGSSSALQGGLASVQDMPAITTFPPGSKKRGKGVCPQHRGLRTPSRTDLGANLADPASPRQAGSCSSRGKGCTVPAGSHGGHVSVSTLVLLSRSWVRRNSQMDILAITRD